MSKMSNCKFCGKEIAKNAKSCPSCGAKNKKPLYLRWWFITIVVIFLLGAIGSSGSKSSNNTNKTTTSADTSSNTTTTKEVEKPKEKYEIVGDTAMEKDSIGIYYITGTLKNNSGRTANYVQISFNLYDKSGAQVGQAFANVSNLDADGNWKFKAMVTNTDNSVVSYKLAEVTGF